MDKVVSSPRGLFIVSFPFAHGSLPLGDDGKHGNRIKGQMLSLVGRVDLAELCVVQQGIGMFQELLILEQRGTFRESDDGINVKVPFTTLNTLHRSIGRLLVVILDIVAERSRSRNGKVHLDRSVQVEPKGLNRSQVQIHGDQDLLAQVSRESSFLPTSSLKGTAIHREIRLEDSITSSNGSGVKRNPQNVRSGRRGEPDVL